MMLVETPRGLTDAAWSPNHDGSPQFVAVAEAKLGVSFPEDYKAVLSIWNGGSFAGSESLVNLIAADELVGHNMSEFFIENIPGMFVFGDDGGGGIYFFDPKHALGHGAFAIHYASMGLLSLEDSAYLATSITELFEKALAGAYFGDLLFKKRRKS